MKVAERITHAELIKAGERWLRKTQRCVVVLSDVNTWATSENPDILGWNRAGFSTIVECKASRADFLRDLKKPFRMHPEQGIGVNRFYVVPYFSHASMDAGNVIRSRTEVPQGWGVLHASRLQSGLVHVERRGMHFGGQNTMRNEAAEKQLMVEALRRAVEGWGRGMFGEAAPRGMVDGDAGKKPARIIRELREENDKLRAAYGLPERRR